MCNLSKIKMDIRIDPQNLLLICFLLGFTKGQNLHLSDIGITVPMWSISGPNFSMSGRRRRQIVMRSGITILVIRLLMNQHHMRNHRFFCSLFRRIFKTGSRSESVAHPVCRQTIPQNPWVSIKISDGNPKPDSIFMKTHPTLPLAVSVNYDHRSKESSIIVKILSGDRTQVVHEIRFKQSDFQPSLTWHDYLPFFATCSGRLPSILDLDKHSDSKLSTDVTVYQVNLDDSSLTPRAILKGSQSTVTAVAFCPNDQLRVATGDISGGVKIFDIRNGECKCIFRPLSSHYERFYSNYSISSIKWMNPMQIVTITLNQEMKCVQILTDDKFEIRTFENPIPKGTTLSHQNLVCMVYHPSRRFFVTCSLSTLTLWDASFGIQSTLSLGSRVYSLRFNRLGNLLIVGSSKNLMIVGVSPNGNQMRLLAQNEVHTRHISDIVIVDHTDDDNYISILSAGINGSLVSSKI